MMAKSQNSWASVSRVHREKIRKAVFERDGYRCQIRGPKCTVVAEELDHIVPRKDGGRIYDEDNCRAACRACNRGRRPGKGRPAKGSPTPKVSAADCTRSHSTVGAPSCPDCGRLGPSRAW